jgi:hypothetical protein
VRSQAGELSLRRRVLGFHPFTNLNSTLACGRQSRAQRSRAAPSRAARIANSSPINTVSFSSTLTIKLPVPSGAVAKHECRGSSWEYQKPQNRCHVRHRSPRLLNVHLRKLPGEVREKVEESFRNGGSSGSPRTLSEPPFNIERRRLDPPRAA